MVPATRPPASQPSPSPSTEPSASPRPTRIKLHPVGARLTADHVNLRMGPGSTFLIITSYPEDSQVVVIGRVPGGEWVQVETEDDLNGWMSTLFLEPEEDLAVVPEALMGDVFQFKGRVTESSGKPIAGVTFAVYQEGESNVRTDARSNADGMFYAYLPLEATGEWTIEVVGISCSSPIVDKDCVEAGHFQSNKKTFPLPPPPVPVIFIYER